MASNAARSVRGTGAHAARDPFCHAFQEQVDWPWQFRCPADRGACRLRRHPPVARFTESPGVHDRGERLEIGFPGQVVVVVLETFSRVKQLRRGLADLRRTWLASAAADELHLGAQPSDLSLLEVGQVPEFGYR